MEKFKGLKKAPAWLKQKYRETVKFVCMQCGQHEDVCGKLIPHRILQGNQGGLYTLYRFNDPRSNVKIVCRSCHGKFHYRDNPKTR
jgi:hypothetical protein